MSRLKNCSRIRQARATDHLTTGPCMLDCDCEGTKFFFCFVSTQQRNTISKKKQKTCASGGCIVYRRKIWKQVQAKGQKAFKRVVAFPSITADREKEKRVYSHSAHLVSFKFSVYLYLVYRSESYI